jgi:hypothetical protein
MAIGPALATNALFLLNGQLASPEPQKQVSSGASRIVHPVRPVSQEDLQRANRRWRVLMNVENIRKRSDAGQKNGSTALRIFQRGDEISSSAEAGLKTVPSFAARIRAPHSEAETAGQ